MLKITYAGKSLKAFMCLRL